MLPFYHVRAYTRRLKMCLVESGRFSGKAPLCACSSSSSFRAFDIKEVIFVKFCVVRFKLFFTLHHIPLCSCIVADLNARTTKSKDYALCTRALFFFSTRRVFYSTPENNNSNNTTNNRADDETMLRGGDSLCVTHLSLLRMATSRRPREDKGREEEDDLCWC